MDTERRTLLRHGALMLLASALVGIGVALGPPHPDRWMAAHVSGLMTGILTMAFGGAWPDLRLTPGARRLALGMGLTAGWLGLAANAFAAAVNLPGPATAPGQPPAATWHAVVFFSMLAVIVPATLGAFFLVWKGLRR